MSPVNLIVDSVSGSSESCVLAVNCSTVDSSIHHSFRCDDKNCSQVKEKTFKPTNYSSSFIVYLQQDFILCNHSNQVSWEYNKIKFDCKTITGKYKNNNNMNDKSTLIYYSAQWTKNCKPESIFSILRILFVSRWNKKFPLKSQNLPCFVWWRILV